MKKCYKMNRFCVIMTKIIILLVGMKGGGGGDWISVANSKGAPIVWIRKTKDSCPMRLLGLAKSQVSQTFG